MRNITILENRRGTLAVGQSSDPQCIRHLCTASDASLVVSKETCVVECYSSLGCQARQSKVMA